MHKSVIALECLFLLLVVIHSAVGQSKTNALYIDMLDGNPALSVREVPGQCSVAGNITTGTAKWLYIITRHGNGKWYVHNAGIFIGKQTDNFSNGMSLQPWQIDGVTLSRHGGLGTTVEICSIGVSKRLKPGNLDEKVLTQTDTLISEPIRLRIGLRRAPRLRIVSIWDKPTNASERLAGSREALISGLVQDIPAGAFVYPVVQPINDEKRWVSKIVSQPPYNRKWDGTIYLGRRDPRKKDNYHDFWVSLVVIRKQLANSNTTRQKQQDSEEEGISFADWEKNYRPYIIAHSETFKVQRTAPEQDAQITITKIGAQQVERGHEGTSGYPQLKVDDIGECSGDVYLPQTSSLDLANLRVWILTQPKDASSGADWTVLAGPIKIKDEGTWALSPLKLTIQKSLFCMAVLGKASPPAYQKGRPVTDEARSSAIASDYVLVYAEKH